MKSTRLTLLAGLTLALSLIQPAPASADYVDVLVNEHGFLVTGGVLLDQRYQGDRREALTCTDCHWKLVQICHGDDPSPNCPELATHCPAGEEVLKVYRADARRRPAESSDLWHFTGHSCLPPTGVFSHELASCLLFGRWAKWVMPPEFHTSPPNRTLVNLPTKVVWDSPARTIDRVDLVQGLMVTFRATAIRQVACPRAGGCVADGPDEFRYLSRGERTLQATAIWRGSYDALGLTNIPVSGDPAIRTAERPLKVFQLRRKLRFPF